MQINPYPYFIIDSILCLSVNRILQSTRAEFVVANFEQLACRSQLLKQNK